MTVAFRGAGAYTTTLHGNALIQVPIPAATVVGDLMVMLSTGAGALGGSGLSGWNTLGTINAWQSLGVSYWTVANSKIADAAAVAQGWNYRNTNTDVALESVILSFANPNGVLELAPWSLSPDGSGPQLIASSAKPVTSSRIILGAHPQGRWTPASVPAGFPYTQVYLGPFGGGQLVETLCDICPMTADQPALVVPTDGGNGQGIAMGVVLDGIAAAPAGAGNKAARHMMDRRRRGGASTATPRRRR
jgi:hypothetical protein